MQDIWQLLDQKQSNIMALQIELAAAVDQYSRLKTSWEANVCQWEWSSSLPRYELDPLYFFNDSVRRGRPTKKQPRITKGKHQYGFDSLGRIVVEREHTNFADRFYERFYTYRESEISAYLYSYDPSKEPINCSRLELNHGVPTSFHSRAQGGSQSHVYIPQKGVVRYFCSLYMPDGREPFGGDGELIFKDGEVIELWHCLPDGDRKLSFSGSSSLYNSLAGLIAAGANNSFNPMPLRGTG